MCFLFQGAIFHRMVGKSSISSLSYVPTLLKYNKTECFRASLFNFHRSTGFTRGSKCLLPPVFARKIHQDQELQTLSHMDASAQVTEMAEPGWASISLFTSQYKVAPTDSLILFHVLSPPRTWPGLTLSITILVKESHSVCLDWEGEENKLIF